MLSLPVPPSVGTGAGRQGLILSDAFNPGLKSGFAFDPSSGRGCAVERINKGIPLKWSINNPQIFGNILTKILCY
jgi:hypothetical protein